MKNKPGRNSEKMKKRHHKSLCMCIIICLTKIIGVSSSQVDHEPCTSIEREYNSEKCKAHWSCTTKKLLKLWDNENGYINLTELSGEDVQVSSFLHTPLLLRIVKGKLYCVQHPKVRELKSKVTVKAYRALHYINRLNRILQNSPGAIPDGTEWWTHQADRVKIPVTQNPFPLFGYSGARGYADIAGIPFMSFSDKLGKCEEEAFKRTEKQPWDKRADSIFFRGSLSDCLDARVKHNGDINFCARAKIVYAAANSKLSILKDMTTTSSFRDAGLNIDCLKCQERSLSPQEFVNRLCSHKYLLNLPGLGQSRRMSQLLRSGGVIFQAKNDGYQFYDFDLKPGMHYISFDPQLGIPGAGNLISSFHNAKVSKSLQNIAKRTVSYAENCLTESSIDFFVASLLENYSKLLVGKSLKFPMVDLSECVVKKEKRSISRLCPRVIEKCWFR